MRILIVDDSRAMQTIVRRGIEQLGYHNIELKKASNGLEALDIIRTWEPELVLSDWYMPEMTGMELLAALNREMLGINIGFVTTESSPEKLQAALDAGAQFIVQKPFDFKTLHEAVLPIIQGSQESEKTLEEQAENTPKTEHITLPSLDVLVTCINKEQKSSRILEAKPAPPFALTKKQFPYLLGLYGDAKKQAVYAVAIVDLNAACILANIQDEIEEDSIHIALAERALPKHILEACQQTLRTLETSLINNEYDTHLTLRSANLMHKDNDSVNILLEKTGEERLDIAIRTKGLEPGRLTLIVS